ncbi:MAG: flavodoxin family protein [Candidatus Thorarchaeota archaeon]|nr:MAG: flavodoxin family protein [Candidatus Thorarchaeota archaeon]
MQVLVFNSSPRRGRGATAGILNRFLKGVEDAGGKVELIYVSDLDIKPCRGCFTCWTKTPGKCVQSDDMAELLPKMDSADVVVLATPVYVDGMTGSLKMLLDRFIPLESGKVELIDGHCRHPRRSGRSGDKLVLLSVCGFAEMDNFDSLVAHVKAMSKNMHRDYVGAVLRPYAWALGMPERIGIEIGDIVQALEDAGRQLVEEGRFYPETLATISKELLPQQVVAQMISSGFR